MDRRYKHLNSEERGVIFAEYRRRVSLRAIGTMLGRSPSTIGREIARGNGDDGGYCPLAGRQNYDTRRARSRRLRRLLEGSTLHTWVHGKLVHLGWSPEQIAGKLRAMHPNNPDRRVSHETIYAAIYAQPRGRLKAAMIEALRQGKSSRGRRRTTLAGADDRQNE